MSSPSLQASGADADPLASAQAGTPPVASRVAVTPQAADMIRRLRGEHGPLMFHQSGGCCDGSSPMCFPVGDFLTGDSDQLLGVIEAGTPEPIEVWMSKEQFAYWRHTHLTIDLVPGRGAGFSLEGPTGFRFLIRSRLLSEEELAALDVDEAAAVGAAAASPGSRN